MGLPNISADWPFDGIKLLIENEVHGILVDVGDVDAFSTQKEMLNSDLDFVKKLSENAVRARS